MSDLALPVLHEQSLPMLTALSSVLGIPRDALASDEQVRVAWASLPRVLTKIPAELRTEQHMRMCVAVAVGLFDAAVNYAWNSAVVELRRKVRDFGIHVVPQITQKPFDEKALDEMKDSDLLSLCLGLNLIDEDGFFFLGQCRNVRNNFSSAHPPMGSLDEYEFLAFLNRCAKYALSSTTNPRGVDIQAFIAALKQGKFSDAQLEKWVELLSSTHEAQRDTLFGTLHGLYCDPNTTEETRLNALGLCEKFAPAFSPATRSVLINRHNEYLAQGKDDRQKASRDFFSRLGMLTLLGERERHGMFSRACEQLRGVHLEFNNFYNEPPFAAGLLELSTQVAVPASAQDEYVYNVVLCATGSEYGCSWAAAPYYSKMVQNFSPREVAIMLSLPEVESLFSRRLREFPRCKQRFGELVLLLDERSVPVPSRSAYEAWRIRGA